MLTALQQVERIARSPRRGAVTSGGRGIVVEGRRRAVLRLSPRSEITAIKEGISRDEPARDRRFPIARFRARARAMDPEDVSRSRDAFGLDLPGFRKRFENVSKTFRKRGIIFLSSSEGSPRGYKSIQRDRSRETGESDESL